ncbi:hypothetical protein ElyMa_002172300 [Elysia marginata]|uniref:Uncharacterized protein n=1 Tax=Elysia marginata TaxID=1093978 RepID=A0AAV4FQ10_9GAST|nr:hypothetical protein ElyMa_002172300 [Elysia marginata]
MLGAIAHRQDPNVSVDSIPWWCRQGLARPWNLGDVLNIGPVDLRTGLGIPANYVEVCLHQACILVTGGHTPLISCAVRLEIAGS